MQNSHSSQRNIYKSLQRSLFVITLTRLLMFIWFMTTSRHQRILLCWTATSKILVTVESRWRKSTPSTSALFMNIFSFSWVMASSHTSIRTDSCLTCQVLKRSSSLTSSIILSQTTLQIFSAFRFLLMTWTKSCKSSFSIKKLSCWMQQLYAAAHWPELPVEGLKPGMSSHTYVRQTRHTLRWLQTTTRFLMLRNLNSN